LVHWRSLSPADAAGLVDLRAAAEAVDRTGEHVDEVDVLEELGDPTLDVEQETIGAWDDVEPVAYGHLSGTAEFRDVARVTFYGTVRPSHRRQGIGRQVLEWATDRAAAGHAARHPGRPGELLMNVVPANVGHVALAEAAGFEPVRRFHVMRHALVDLPAIAPPPRELRLQPFDFELDDATRRGRNVAFADHWGSVDRDEVVWGQWFTGQRAFRAAVSFLLLDDASPDDPVAGFVLSYEFEADTAGEGVRQVWLGQIGVRPEWRGRGAAKALMTRALSAYRDTGYERAVLDVDTENASGALRLYEGTGWTEAFETVMYARPIGPPGQSRAAVTLP
jgi:ribosomal protein S18 acetylase RimI-like enzyme